jgi:hypothetical protein
LDVHVRELRQGEAVNDPIHHRRFASGFRACELGGGSTPTTEGDTEDTTVVTCKSCISELRQRGLIAVREPIKLSELVAARAKMTKAPWKIDDEVRHAEPRVCDGECGNPDPGSSHVDCGTVIYRDGCCERDSVGIVATHNAADVLIEIAQAALELNDCMNSLGEYEGSGYALERFRATIAKVEP